MVKSFTKKYAIGQRWESFDEMDRRLVEVGETANLVFSQLHPMIQGILNEIGISWESVFEQVKATNASSIHEGITLAEKTVVMNKILVFYFYGFFMILTTLPIILYEPALILLTG